jgi:arylesterase / paraoxonase
MPKFRSLIIPGVIVLALVLFAWTRYMARSGEFTTLQPLWEGACEPVATLGAFIDLAPNSSDGALLLINGEGGPLLQWENPVQGVVLTQPLSASDPRFIAVREDSVFVASEKEGSVRVTRLDPRGAAQGYGQEQLVAEFAAPAGFSGFAAHPSGDLLFAFTGVAEPGGLAHALARIASRRDGQLLVWRDGALHRVDDKLGYPSGLAILDGKLWLGEADRAGLRPYSRGEDGTWLEETAVFVGTAITALKAHEGRLWAVAQPKFQSYLAITGDGTRIDPKGMPLAAQVIVIEPGQQRIDQVLMTVDGTPTAPLVVAFGDAEPSQLMLAGSGANALFACSLPAVWRHSEARPASRPVNRRGEQS